MIDVMTRAADDSRQDISRLTVCLQKKRAKKNKKSKKKKMEEEEEEVCFFCNGNDFGFFPTIL